MIFVILGTQDKSFERMLIEIDNLIRDGIIEEKVIVQAGSTVYKTDTMEILDYIPMEDFKKYIQEADFVIAHGGVGSILDAIKYDKKVIAIPRLEKYNEHENNHQIQVVEKFDELGYIVDCGNLKRLGNKIMQINKFVPKKYESNNEKFVSKLEKYIGD